MPFNNLSRYAHARAYVNAICSCACVCSLVGVLSQAPHLRSLALLQTGFRHESNCESRAVNESCRTPPPATEPKRTPRRPLSVGPNAASAEPEQAAEESSAAEPNAACAEPAWPLHAMPVGKHCLELQDALQQLPPEIHHKMLPASRTVGSGRQRRCARP